MHLKSMRFWMGAYVALALFDAVVTGLFVSQERFGVMYEGNVFARNLMTQYGIWQGLTLCIVQDFTIFFVLWGLFYYITMRLIKGSSQQSHVEIDIVIFNAGVPYVIIVGVLPHFCGGLSWIMFGLAGWVDVIDPQQLLIYVSIIYWIFKAYQVYKINLKDVLASDQSILKRRTSPEEASS